MQRFKQRIVISSVMAIACIGLAGCAVYPAPGPYYYGEPQAYPVYRPYPYYRPHYGYYGGGGYYGGDHYGGRHYWLH